MFILNNLKLSKSLFFLYPLSFVFASWASKEPLPIQPKRIIDLYNTKKGLRERKGSREKLKQCKILISPSGKDAIFAVEKGDVCHLPLTLKQSATTRLTTLFTHPRLKFAPLLALAQLEDQPLTIASAGNFQVSGTEEWHSTIITYCNGTYKQTALTWPIQSIALNKTGKQLVIGGRASVALLNRETDSISFIVFPPGLIGSPLKDITISPSGKFIIAANQFGKIQLIQINQENNKLITQPEVDSNLNIETIHCPDNEKLIIHSSNLTSTKAIAIKHLLLTKTKKDSLEQPLMESRLKQPIEVKPIEKPIIPSRSITDSKTYEQIALNTGEYSASAHWTTKNDASEKRKHTIKVFWLKNDEIEKYRLMAPTYENSYQMQSPSGLVNEYKEGFFDVAFHNNVLIAIGSCGKLFIWNFKKIPPITTEVSNEIDHINTRKPRRPRSRSFGHLFTEPLVSIPEINNKQQQNDITTTTTTTQNRPDTPRAIKPVLPLSALSPRKQHDTLPQYRTARKSPTSTTSTSSQSSRSTSPRNDK